MINKDVGMRRRETSLKFVGMGFASLITIGLGLLFVLVGVLLGVFGGRILGSMVGLLVGIGTIVVAFMLKDND